MPITSSARKKLRVDERKTKTNLLLKTRLKKAIKNARRQSTPKALDLAASLLDRAAKNKLIHTNKANRLKSRLAKAAGNKSVTSHPKKKKTLKAKKR